MPTQKVEERTVNASASADGTQEDTNAIIAKSRQVLAVLQGYLLPLLYGWIGATAYVVRSLSREARERPYRRENDTAYTLRIFLGSLAGLAIGWFLKPEEVTGFKAISPFALAFAAEYSVDLPFTPFRFRQDRERLLRAARCSVSEGCVGLRRSPFTIRRSAFGGRSEGVELEDRLRMICHPFRTQRERSWGRLSGNSCVPLTTGN
jgi:hypothetical protein